MNQNKCATKNARIKSGQSVMDHIVRLVMDYLTDISHLHLHSDSNDVAKNIQQTLSTFLLLIEIPKNKSDMYCVYHKSRVSTSNRYMMGGPSVLLVASSNGTTIELRITPKNPVHHPTVHVPTGGPILDIFACPVTEEKILVLAMHCWFLWQPSNDQSSSFSNGKNESMTFPDEWKYVSHDHNPKAAWHPSGRCFAIRVTKPASTAPWLVCVIFVYTQVHDKFVLSNTITDLFEPRYNIQFSLDGQWLMAETRSDQLFLYDTQTWARVHTLSLINPVSGSKFIHSTTLSLDGTRLAFYAEGHLILRHYQGMNIMPTHLEEWVLDETKENTEHENTSKTPIMMREISTRLFGCEERCKIHFHPRDSHWLLLASVSNIFILNIENIDKIKIYTLGLELEPDIGGHIRNVVWSSDGKYIMAHCAMKFVCWRVRLNDPCEELVLVEHDYPHWHYHPIQEKKHWFWKEHPMVVT